MARTVSRMSEIQHPVVVAESQNLELFRLPESLLDFVNSGDEDMVREILALFQQDTAERLRGLNLAVSNGDRVALRKQAHTLKGAALQVGAVALSRIFVELEKHAEDGPQATLLDLAYRACDCYDRTCREMLPENYR